jgi:hypothetical protein
MVETELELTLMGLAVAVPAALVACQQPELGFLAVLQEALLPGLPVGPETTRRLAELTLEPGVVARLVVLRVPAVQVL